jgi:hypothetical protein
VRNSSRGTGSAGLGRFEPGLGGGSLGEDTSVGVGSDVHVFHPDDCERFHLLLFHWDCQENFTVGRASRRVR